MLGRYLLKCLVAVGLVLAPSLARADSTVSAMTAASAMTGTELFYCVQSAADRKCTAAQTQIAGSGGGTTNFLRADGTWTTPPGGIPLTGNGATITVSTPLIDVSQTWNAAGVTFTGLRANITNTASLGGSKILDVQVGGTSAVRVESDGNLVVDQQTGAFASKMFEVKFQGGSVFSVATLTTSAARGLAFGNGGHADVISVDAGNASIWSPALKVVGFGDSAANTNGWIQWGGLTRAAGDSIFTSNTTLANIMTVNVQAGRTYSFDVYLSITGSAGGVQATIAGSATTTNVRYDGYVIDNGAGGTKGAAQASALSTVVANPATITGPASVVIRGTVTVLAAGTLIVQAAQATSSATSTVIKQGSYAWFHDMP